MSGLPFRSPALLIYHRDHRIIFLPHHYYITSQDVCEIRDKQSWGIWSNLRVTLTLSIYGLLLYLSIKGMVWTSKPFFAQSPPLGNFFYKHLAVLQLKKAFCTKFAYKKKFPTGGYWQKTVLRSTLSFQLINTIKVDIYSMSGLPLPFTGLQFSTITNCYLSFLD